MTLGGIAGPALGGVLLATVGLATTYAVDTATFVLSLAALRMMRAVPPPPEAEPPSLRRIGEGVRYAGSRQDLMGTYIVDIVAMFFGMPMALFPAAATHLGGAGVLGLLYAAPAAGSLLATVTSGWTAHVHRHGAAVCVAAAVWGAGIVVFGLATGLGLALLGLVLAGGADMISASSARRSGTRRSPTNCAGGWQGSSRSATRPARCSATWSPAWSRRSRACVPRSSPAGCCASPAWPSPRSPCRRSGATTPGNDRSRAPAVQLSASSSFPVSRPWRAGATAVSPLPDRPG